MKFVTWVVRIQLIRACAFADIETSGRVVKSEFGNLKTTKFVNSVWVRVTAVMAVVQDSKSGYYWSNDS